MSVFCSERTLALKKLSLSLLANTVSERRKAKKITQKQLSELTGINRALLSRLESRDFTPSIDQLQALGEALGFENVGTYMIVGLVGLNFVFEFVINLILCPAIVMLIKYGEKSIARRK